MFRSDSSSDLYFTKAEKALLILTTFIFIAKEKLPLRIGEQTKTIKLLKIQFELAP